MIKKLLIAVPVFVLMYNFYAFSQIQKNKYGLFVINDIKTYKEAIKNDSNKILVDLEKFIPGIKLDIRYATKNNFLGEPVYKKAKAFLRLPAAIQLKKIQNELRSKNLELKIFDSYRPYEATVLFYEKVKDTVYVASARKGSRHNRGCAVDLTIISSETGKEIKMPTGFDDFTEKAHSDYSNLPEEVIKNRKMLIEIMSKYGFTNYPAEWWHYDFNGWKNYNLMNLSFEELKNL